MKIGYMPYIIPLIMSVLTGFSICSLLWPDSRPLRSMPLCFFWGCALGSGLSTIILFISLFFPNGHLFFWTIEIIFCLIITSTALAVSGFRWYQTIIMVNTPKGFKYAAGKVFSKAVWIIPGLIPAVPIFYLFSQSFEKSLMMPHGHWDAWAIWVMRARMIFRAGADWTATFSHLHEWVHPDYPLLYPLMIVRAWLYHQAGGESLLVPLILSGMFTASILGVLFFTICYLKDVSAAVLAVSCLAGMSFFFEHGLVSRYADAPLALYFLVTLGVFMVHDADPNRKRRLLILAGAAMGFAAWTKNEGVLFIISVLIARLVYAAVRNRWWESVKDGGFLAAGLALPLTVLIFFKWYLAPPNDILAGQHFFYTALRIIDINRYAAIFQLAWRSAFTVANWGWGIPVIAGYALIVTLHRKSDFVRLLTPGVIIICMLSGYFGVYLITPLELTYHISTSAARLGFQLIPAVILAVLGTVRSPLDIWRTSRNFFCHR